MTCSGNDATSSHTKSEPTLLAEVLSPSTAAYDRGMKFAHYRSLPSLQEYVLIEIDTRTTDCYRKGSVGLWVLHPFARGESIALASVGMELTADAVFAEVEDEQPTSDSSRIWGQHHCPEQHCSSEGIAPQR